MKNSKLTKKKAEKLNKMYVKILKTKNDLYEMKPDYLNQDGSETEYVRLIDNVADSLSTVLDDFYRDFNDIFKKNQSK